MAMTPAYTLAHVFYPNLVKLKGALTVMSSLERKDKIFFDPLWQQAMVTHNPSIRTERRDAFRIGVMTMPPPKEMGEAHMAGLVLEENKPTPPRYFTLEHDFVLKTNSSKTLLCERDGAKHIKHGDGPVLTGDVEQDMAAFIDAFMAIVAPKAVDPGRNYR